MNTGERLYAVISGCVCVILALVLCSFLPLGVQSQSDKLSEITCTALRVVNNRGGGMKWFDCWLANTEDS